MRAVARLATAKGVKPSQLALAWTIAQGAMPIPGTRRIPYLEEDVAAASITLAEAEPAEPAEPAESTRPHPAGQMETLTR